MLRSVNENGTPANLVASHPGNLDRVKSGLWSSTGRVLAPRAEEIAAALMELPHVTGVDILAAEEIGSILAQLEAIDLDLIERPARRDRKTLLEHKARLGRELRSWLREFGGTPKSRADWAMTMAHGGLAAEIRRRTAQATGDKP